VIRRSEIRVLLIADFVTICLSWLFYFIVRVRSGWLDVIIEPDLWLPMASVYLFWLVVFTLVGLYRPWYAASRFDELALLFKTISLGCLFLFFVVFFDDSGRPTGVSSRLLIAIYWAILLLWVSAGRLALRSIQRRMLIAGIGAHDTLIVGSAVKSRALYDEVVKYPGLGYRVRGFVAIDRRRIGTSYRDIPVIGALDELSRLIENRSIREVLIALDSTDHGRLLDIIGRCDGQGIGLKIMPDLYDIISGQARTNQIYGFPLIAISTQIMPPWEESMKRALDVAVALLVLVIGLPMWLLIAALIRLESSGPVFYKQERLGRDAVRFNIVKFRSMRQDAEKAGPQWAGKRDPRVTRVGKVLRSLHLDEIPQMINVLDGHMSLIGPRPERPMFVEDLAKEIPLYMRRLRVRPGITGWAQVKHTYDETIDDVRKKVQYDLFYIENMSLRMDFKIILSTFAHMMGGKGR
jgi:exopolysaccharide biosynthesis polyprenyl glycosylphosphotransferase